MKWLISLSQIMLFSAIVCLATPTVEFAKKILFPINL